MEVIFKLLAKFILKPLIKLLLIPLGFLGFNFVFSMNEELELFMHDYIVTKSSYLYDCDYSGLEEYQQGSEVIDYYSTYYKEVCPDKVIEELEFMGYEVEILDHEIIEINEKDDIYEIQVKEDYRSYETKIVKYILEKIDDNEDPVDRYKNYQIKEMIVLDSYKNDNIILPEDEHIDDDW